MKKWIKQIAITLLVVVCVCCLFVYVAVPITVYEAKRRVFSDYAEHREILAELVVKADLDGNLFRNLFGDLFGVDGMQIPDELKSLGIGDVFVSHKKLFLVYEDGVLWFTGFGMVYVEDLSSLAEWYVTYPIEDNWYFYYLSS